MLDPVALTRLSQIRQQELLQEAEAARQGRGKTINLAGFGGRIRAAVGTVLIVAGQKLGAESHSDVKVPA